MDRRNRAYDPYEEYREPPTGCGSAIAWAGIIASLAFVLFMMCSCAVQHPPLTNTRDSVRIEYRLDSVYIVKHDSVWRDRWRSGDTVYITTEKWLTRYKDKIVLQHDTIYNDKTQEVAVEYVPQYYKSVSKGFWVLLAIILAFVGYKVARFIIMLRTGK